MIALWLPAFVFGVWTSWQLVALYGAYLMFLLGAVWNAIATGQLAQKTETKAVQKELGISTTLATAGLWLTHPLAIWDFAKQKSLAAFVPETASMWLALALLTTAILLIHHSTRTLGKFFDRLTLKDDHVLITKGAYSVIRHPIYLSYLLLFSGFCLLMQSLLALISSMILGGVVFGAHIRIEERMLEERFGSAYREYQAKTKKLIPFIY
ncbi:MAG: isoprenylcysteine carboxylmethyltransferase family protein [Chloroherpetonaceae bacterium]|nr:isoprenylcysteine carboxylmethyltransferase family protein [Chloroherpetonaceae bacterium]MDW8438813.1 isoprenylcysteine carboxylmethyltransferase family protein [Chloroherpetonaceae bacterium]